MRDRGAFFSAIERGHALNETLRGLVQEEARLAGCEEPYPHEPEGRVKETGTRMEETAREIARLFEQAPSVPGGMDHDEEAKLLLILLRRNIEETLGMIREASRTIREARDGVLFEINQSDKRNAAVRAYIMNS